MGKCHGITFVRWIVKHLVSYMAAAQQDNRLISWLSEPYRTISLFLTLIPFSLDIRLIPIHTFTVHSVNTYPVDTQGKKYTIFALFPFFLQQRQPGTANQFQTSIRVQNLGDSFSNSSTICHCQRGHNSTLHQIPRYHLKDYMFCSCDLMQKIMSIHLRLNHSDEHCQNRLSTRNWL